MQLNIRKGRVVRIKDQRPGAVECMVEFAGGERGQAVNYPNLTGGIDVGDEVLLNTTAVELELGTGGSHFILYVFSGDHAFAAEEPGHIMKLRYTPLQHRCLSCEEKEGPLHEELRNADTLDGRPVLVVGLHSMLPPAAAGIAAARAGEKRAVYVMTDGGALPLALSRNVNRLKRSGLLRLTVTAGHAFGGDYEAVGLHSALLAAHHLCPAEEGILVVGIGPGVVGTGTRFGHTGLEQGRILNAVSALNGTPVCVPRISFADTRQRHRILSHHTVTALGRVALACCYLTLPILPSAQSEALYNRLKGTGLSERHQLVEASGEEGLQRLCSEGIGVKSMGRTPREDPAFFLAAAAGGKFAAGL